MVGPKFVSYPTRPLQKVSVIAGETDEYQRILDKRLAHRVDERRESTRIGPIVLLRRDKWRVGTERSVEFDDSRRIRTGQFGRGSDGMVGPIAHTCVLEERVVVGGEDIPPRKTEQLLVEITRLVVVVGHMLANQIFQTFPVEGRFVLAGNPLGRWSPASPAGLRARRVLRRRVEMLPHVFGQFLPSRKSSSHTRQGSRIHAHTGPHHERHPRALLLPQVALEAVKVVPVAVGNRRWRRTHGGHSTTAGSPSLVCSAGGDSLAIVDFRAARAGPAPELGPSRPAAGVGGRSVASAPSGDLRAATGDRVPGNLVPTLNLDVVCFFKELRQVLLRYPPRFPVRGSRFGALRPLFSTTALFGRPADAPPGVRPGARRAGSTHRRPA